MNVVIDYDHLPNYLTKFKKIKAVDLETTGLAANCEKIIEYGSYTVNLEEGTTSELDLLIQPERELPEIITNITGLTDKDLEGKPTFKDVKDLILNDLMSEDTLIIAHNAKFDIGFLVAEFNRLGINLDSYGITYLCTRNLSKYLASKGRFDNQGGNGLEHLMKVLGIEDPNHHRSINDCIMCYNLFNKLKDL